MKKSYTFRDFLGFFRLENLRNALFKKGKEPLKEMSWPTNELAKKLHPSSLSFIIEEVVERTPTSKSYLLKSDSPIYFRPGEYLVVEEEIEGSSVRRPLSICSSPKDGEKGYVEVLVKKTHDGFFSPYAYEKWQVGSKVITSGPEGHFTYNPLRDEAHIVAYAGGSGITPFLSIARAIADDLLPCSMSILYGYRDEKEAAFAKELRDLGGISDKIKIIEKRDEEGYFSAEDILLASEGKPFSLFASGPQGLYNHLDALLKELPLPQKNVRKEVYGIAKDPSFYPDAPIFKGKEYLITVRIRDKSYEVKAKDNETVLVALERAGLCPPSSCRGGSCGACRSKLLSGEVYVPQTLDKRRENDKSTSYIHICISYPMSDLLIEMPSGK